MWEYEIENNLKWENETQNEFKCGYEIANECVPSRRKDYQKRFNQRRLLAVIQKVFRRYLPPP